MKILIVLFLFLTTTHLVSAKSNIDLKRIYHNLKLQDQSFKEFAKDFVDNGISSLSSFKLYCENKLETIDFDKGDYIKESPSKAFSYLKYYFKINKYKIKKNKIDFTDGELTITLFFRKNSDGVWKLYKYDGVA
ncbi:MAG: hypothetical protein JSS63_09895 [Bacteroidetes bacterium]|nr:hypothetical protein [Bacteroidota bacterium]